MVNKLIQKLFYSSEWFIGVVRQDLSSLIKEKQLLSIEWFDKPKKIDYYADPFFFDENSLIFEEFNIENGYGEIKRINFSGEKLPLKGDLNNIPAHQSFPFIFTLEDQKYCIPEMAEFNQINLYSINNDEIKFSKTLVDDFPGLDTTLLFLKGNYWLFTTHNDQPGSLYIYHSKSLKESFIPHNANPIYMNDRISRNAGSLLLSEGKVYRPVQSCVKTYGEAIVIREITVLNQKEFSEKDLFIIKPQSPFNEGIHTLNYCNGNFVVDGKKNKFSLFTPFRKYNKNKSIKIKTKEREQFSGHQKK
jgi:hypothetical protein